MNTRQWQRGAWRTASSLGLLFAISANVQSSVRPDVPQRAVWWLTEPPVDTVHVDPGAVRCLRIRGVKQDSAHLSVYCSLLDQQGEPVTDIKASNLGLSLDGRDLSPVDVELFLQRADEHLVVVLALGFTDSSKAAPPTLSALSNSFIPDLEESKPDLCALLTFDGRISVPRLFSSDPLLLKQSLSSIHFSGEGLAVNAAIDAARTLIHQHDTTGFGAVVLAGDLAGAAVEGPSVPGPIGISDATPVFALGTARKRPASDEAWARLCTATRGENIVTTRDSLSVRTAVSRVMGILQGMYVIRIPGSVSGQLRLDYALDGGEGSLADSVMLATTYVVPREQPETSKRSRLVIMSLAVGAVLLALILVLHARSRAR